MSDLAAMLQEVEVLKQRTQRWLAEYDFLPCDAPDCRHPCCRGKTVAERKAQGRVLELSQLETSR